VRVIVAAVGDAQALRQEESAAMQLAVLILAIVAYSFSTLTFYLTFVHSPANFSSRVRHSRATLIAAVVLHLADIVYRSVVTRTCPVTSAEFGLSLAALVSVVAFLVWARQDKLLALGVIVAPLGLGLFVASSVVESHEITPHVPAWFLAVHVTANLLSVGLFVVAAAGSIAYLLQSSRIKAKRATVGQAPFPGLSSLESLSHRFLGLGLGPMTIGVVSGAVFAERLTHGGMESLRIALSYVCWLVAAAVVLGQRITGWHGRRVAWGTIFAAVLAVGLVLLYAIMNGSPS